MIVSKAYDIEILPNIFTITIVDVRDYLEKMKDVSINTHSAKEIESILASVQTEEYYIYEADDYQKAMQLYARFMSMLSVRHDLFAYNSYRYDKLMIAGFLQYVTECKDCKSLCMKLYKLSVKIIEAQDYGEEYYRDIELKSLSNYPLPFVDIDLMKIFALDKIKKGLKNVAINLEWYNILEFELPEICEKDIPLYEKERYYSAEDSTEKKVSKLKNRITKWQRKILPEYIPSFMYYNRNDVFVCCEIIRQKAEEIRLRYGITAKYGVDVLNSSRADIADKITIHLYSKFTGLKVRDFIKKQTIRTRMSMKNIIDKLVSFKTDNLKKVYDKIYNTAFYNTKDAFDTSFEIGGTEYTIGLGGLHSKDYPSKFEKTEKYIYKDADVRSWYPELVRRRNIRPSHIYKQAWEKLINMLIDDRIKAKKEGDDVTAETLKIVINAGIFGKMLFEFSFLFDRQAGMQVTVNGQLFLLMLIEALELAGINVISANTDGIVSKIPVEKENLYHQICDTWCKMLNVELEFAEYIKYIRRDVNCYMAVTDKGKVKFKGAMNEKMPFLDLQKGYNSPIVARCVEKYFLENKPIMETLKECKDIVKFCKTQKAAGKFDFVYTTVKGGVINRDNIQKATRFYVSNVGGVLQKIDKETEKETGICAGNRVTILNNIDDLSIEERDINYAYYYKEALNIIDPIMLSFKTKSKRKRNTKKYSNMYNPLFNEQSYEEIED